MRRGYAVLIIIKVIPSSYTYLLKLTKLELFCPNSNSDKLDIYYRKSYEIFGEYNYFDLNKFEININLTEMNLLLN